jgi:hypothetical protein
MVATLYTFGLKRGVGVDMLSEFCVRVRPQHHLGCASTALLEVMQALEAVLQETAGLADGEGREIMGAVDATFWEQRILVFMDLRTGYLLLDAVAEDRT